MPMTSVWVTSRLGRISLRWSSFLEVGHVLGCAFVGSSSALTLVAGTPNVTPCGRCPRAQCSALPHPERNDRDLHHERGSPARDTCDGFEYGHEPRADDEPGDRSQCDLA